MSALHTYGGLLLGSRLRRLSEMLYSGVDEVYRDHDVRIASRALPLLIVLRDSDGPLAIGEAAERLGRSHVAVSRIIYPLEKARVLGVTGHARDQRKMMLVLMPKGRALLDRLEPVWRAIVAAVDDLDRAILPAVRTLEEALEARGFAERIGEQLRALEKPIEVVPYEARHAADFKRLNLAWIEKLFRVEPIDLEVLSHPERIITGGGAIVMAVRGEEAVGTCALLRHPRGRYELTKMAVDPTVQGQGIGGKLLRAIVACFDELDGKELFLETNSKLHNAIRLYLHNGFAEAERPRGAVHYERSDVYMRFSRARSGGPKRRRAPRGRR